MTSPQDISEIINGSNRASTKIFLTTRVWFWLLRHYLASQLGVFSFVTPLFGVVFGIWLLDEPLEMSFVLGALLVLAGVVLVTNHAWFQARLGRKAA